MGPFLLIIFEMYSIRTHTRTILADTITPVSLYLKIRDIYPKSIMLESSDYHGGRDNYSFICMEPIASVEVKDYGVAYNFPDERIKIEKSNNVVGAMKDFFSSFTAAGLTGLLAAGAAIGAPSLRASSQSSALCIRSRGRIGRLT